MSKEHSQSLIKAIINALIAEKPERTGLLKPQEQQAMTTKKPIAFKQVCLFPRLLLLRNHVVMSFVCNVFVTCLCIRFSLKAKGHKF